MAAVPDQVYDRMRAAEDRVLRNELNLMSHEKECAIRYGHINESMSGLQRDLRTAATAAAGIMLAVLGFLIKLVFFP